MTMVTTKGIHNFQMAAQSGNVILKWVTCFCHHWYKIWCKIKDN